MRSDDTVADVLIVGGGFSGTMAAAQAVRGGLSVVLVEGGARAGQGTAYSTRDEVHLLNVPAAKMSAWADRADDFVEAGFAGGEFAPRRDYGRYLQAILTQAVAAGLVLVEAKAVAARRDGDWVVSLGDGREIKARALVLAQGNQPPEPMRGSEGVDPTLFVNNPWGADAKAAIERVVRGEGDVLVLGTGLTMVDMVLSLDAAGFGGRIVALSRRGQVPRGHAAHDAAPVAWEDVPQGNVLALWCWLRRRSAQVGWRGAVDALRPHAQRLWQGFDESEQGRFLRHARPYWDVHRHRIAPQVAEQLRGMIAAGRLGIVAGRMGLISQDEPQRLGVEILRRGSGAPSPVANAPSSSNKREFAAVFNCTGPLGAMRRTQDPLLRQMIGDGLIGVDRLGMGLAVDAQSRAGERLWALGPLTKGAFWEIVAVPDIRAQVAGVADDIAGEVKHDES